jgi:heparanase 1
VAIALSNKLISRTNDRYVSWTIDTSRGRQFFDLDFTNTTFRYLASQIPTVMRVGGSGGDYLTYELGNKTAACGGDSKHNCLNESQYDGLVGFAKAAGAEIVFALNICPRKNSSENTFCGAGKPTTGHWDSTNAEELLRYSIAKGYQFLGLELGNERNDEQSGASQAADLKILSDLLVRLYPDASSRPLLIGPDSHSIHTVEGAIVMMEWVGDFIKAATALNLKLHAVTHHEYIDIDKQSVFNGSFLDTSAGIAAEVNRTVKKLLPSAEVWGGEIG